MEQVFRPFPFSRSPLLLTSRLFS